MINYKTNKKSYSKFTSIEQAAYFLLNYGSSCDPSMFRAIWQAGRYLLITRLNICYFILKIQIIIKSVTMNLSNIICQYYNRLKG